MKCKYCQEDAEFICNRCSAEICAGCLADDDGTCFECYLADNKSEEEDLENADFEKP